MRTALLFTAATLASFGLISGCQRKPMGGPNPNTVWHGPAVLYKFGTETASAPGSGQSITFHAVNGTVGTYDPGDLANLRACFTRVNVSPPDTAATVLTTYSYANPPGSTSTYLTVDINTTQFVLYHTPGTGGDCQLTGKP